MPRKPALPGDTRRAVLVVGPPRSGTSVVAHMLSKLGVYFGEEADFLDPAIHTHNPIFFELERLNELNERVLRELGYEYRYFDFFPAPDGAWDAFSEDLLADASSLLRNQLDDRTLIGLKDPRFCFTLPFWTRVLAEHGYATSFVWTLRSAGATMRSNVLVNQQAAAYGARVTMLSLGTSAMHLKGLGPRIDVDYDGLVGNPRATAERLAGWLGTDVGIEEAASVVKAELRVQVAGSSGPGEAIDLDEQAGRYLALRTEMERRGVLELLSRRREEVSALGEQIKWWETRTRAFENLANLLDRLGSEIDSRVTPLAGKIEWQSRALVEQGDYLREAMHQAAEAQAQQASLPDALGALVSPLVEKVDWQSRALQEFGEYLRQQTEASLRAEQQLHGEIDRLNREAAESARRVAQAEQALDAGNKELASALEAEKALGATLEAKISELTSALQAEQARSNAAEQAVARRDEEIAGVSRTLQALRSQLASAESGRRHTERQAAEFYERLSALTDELEAAKTRLAAAETPLSFAAWLAKRFSRDVVS